MRRRQTLILFAIAALAGAVRLVRLGGFSYWLDEILQTYWVRGDWHFFWKAIRFDAVHPPLDYLITKGLDFLSPGRLVKLDPALRPTASGP